jgi:hypothetical protein
MSFVEQEISAVDEVDVGIVVVRPTTGPGLRDLKVVSAVSEARTAFDHVDVPDDEVMLVSETSVEVFVGDPALLAVLSLIVMLFLANFAVFVFFFVPVLVLSYGGHRRSQDE